MDLARRRHGNALILVLGIALLLAIQIYVIQTLTVGSFRHVEKVNALIRAIYVGEAAFSQILAKVKADKWENRWFKGLPDGAREYGQTVAGGTYSSVVVDVAVPPGSTDKMVDVWLESRYEGSTQLMYYRVLYTDDTLDFTAQVYPRFFTFLEANDPNPFTGALAPATAHIQDLINQQTNNEAAAIAAINGVRTTCNLAGVTSSLGVTPLGPPLDTLTPPGGAPIDLCGYVTGTLGTLTGMVPPPVAAALPSIPPAPPPPGDFTQVVNAAFVANGYGPLPTTPSGKVSATPNAVLFADPDEADGQWKVEHQDRNYEHYMKEDEMVGLIRNMLDKRDAALTPVGDKDKINTIVTELLAWVSAKSTAAGGRVYAAPMGDKATICSEFLASKEELPPIIPEFREKP